MVFDNGPFSVLGIDLGASPNNGPTATGTLSIRAETMGVVSSILQPQPVGYPALDLRGSPYVVSGMRNSLLVVGCGGSVGVANNNNQTVAGCSTLCSSLSSTMKSNNYSCFGTGCCQSSIPTSLDYFKLEFQATTINGSISESGSVDAVVVDNSFFANNTINGTFFRDFEGDFPTLLLWTVPGLPISSAKYSNSLCDWDADLKGYSCRCRYEYHAGNPYLPTGCQGDHWCRYLLPLFAAVCGAGAFFPIHSTLGIVSAFPRRSSYLRPLLLLPVFSAIGVAGVVFVLDSAFGSGSVGI